MGDHTEISLILNLGPKVRLEFRGTTITSDAEPLACRELDDIVGLTEHAADFLKESRTGEHILYELIPLLKQLIHSRPAGHRDTNDAVGRVQDPDMRMVAASSRS